MPKVLNYAMKIMILSDYFILLERELVSQTLEPTATAKVKRATTIETDNIPALLASEGDGAEAVGDGGTGAGAGGDGAGDGPVETTMKK